MKNIIPTVPEVARETLILLGAAVLAALIVGQLPALRQWMRDQWGVAPMPLPITH